MTLGHLPTNGVEMGNAGVVVVLGGGGGVGSIAVKSLLQTSDASTVLVADFDRGAAESVVAEVADPRLEAVSVDVSNAKSLDSLLREASVVLNCVGPFYKFGPPTLAAAIRSGVNYVDICDDLDATKRLLDLDGAARDAGTTALIGMGNSPGLANLFVKICSEWFLDEVHSAEIMHIHGGEPDEGAGVLKHRIHAMTNDVPVFVDGQMSQVRMLDDSGRPFITDEDFPNVGRSPVFPYPHPETITLPTVFPTLKRVTNQGAVFPLPYFELTQDLVRAGMASEECLNVGGASVAPIDVMVSLLQRRRKSMLADADISGPSGCLKVVVSGESGGQTHRYEIALSSKSEGAGEGTGIPAALGTILMLRGELEGGPGVHPPESIVPVESLLGMAATVASGVGVQSGGLPITLTHISPSGEREEIPFALGGDS